MLVCVGSIVASKNIKILYEYSIHNINNPKITTSHPDFRVSVVTEDGQVRGIVRASRPDGGQAVLILDGAPFQSNVRNGTLLVTTGIAGVYPPGVLVGTVRRVLDAEAGWMKSYIVEPSVRPEEASIVLIWERPKLSEESVPTAPVHSLDSNPTMRP